MIHRTNYLAIVAFALLLAGGGAVEAALITPTNAWSTSYWAHDGVSTLNLINSSGLSANSPAGTHDNHATAATMWIAGDGDGGLGGPTGGYPSPPPSVASQEVVFDLGQAYDLTGTYVWNQNQVHPSYPTLYQSRGTQDFDLYVSSDTDPLTATWTPLGSQTLAMAGGTPAEPSQWVPFTASGARLVKFDIQIAYSGAANEHVGLSEVRFEDASASGGGVMNPSFEDDVLADNQHVFGNPTGWLKTGDAGYQNLRNDLNPQPTDGVQHGFTNGGGTLSQALTDVITDGEVYTLTVDVGEYQGFSGSLATIRLFDVTAGVGTALSNANGTAELTGIDPTNGFYTTDLTVTYTALASGDPFAGQPLGIALIGESGTQVVFDNVRLEISSAALIPEPSTFALAALALLGLGLCGRRWRR